ncbi:2OG-Fe dioxygenase family protein [Nguyenibacter vanlangensis]|uniref:2OG-Fe dioxygenase family protein n=1 Tax=Nguyenibacter vanlangensis TaxID=1216886 RepID=A0A7Y7IVH8_9PROT|nr:2OG-Fe dioxygenase family protein [Nguyenibacter vanlangensis]NVN11089.1 2OG-Fe dioxygenase family protein [Nguyenibacter vanlangensis]
MPADDAVDVRPTPQNLVAARGFATLDSAGILKALCTIRPYTGRDVETFCASWENMPPDTYMADGGPPRRRRHAVYRVAPGGAIERLHHRPHVRTIDHNPLNGGSVRHVEPIADATNANPVMQGFLGLADQIFCGLSPWTGWRVDAYQFRITASANGGKPTPEGAHRDGVAYVLMALIDQRNVRGGETTIYDRSRNPLGSLNLQSPFETAIIDDERVYHGVGPIHACDPGQAAYRDVLVLAFRRIPAEPRRPRSRKTSKNKDRILWRTI